MHIQSLSTRFTLVAVLLAVSACTTAKVVSSSGGGPTIQQAQQEPVAGPKKRNAVAGAQLIIRGSVTEFEPRCKGGAALIIAAQQACVTVNLRIVDAKTGRVVNATTVEGRSGSVGGGLVFATGVLPVGLGGWAKTPMEAAIRNCIETAGQHIANTKL